MIGAVVIYAAIASVKVCKEDLGSGDHVMWIDIRLCTTRY